MFVVIFNILIFIKYIFITCKKLHYMVMNSIYTSWSILPLTYIKLITYAVHLEHFVRKFWMKLRCLNMFSALKILHKSNIYISYNRCNSMVYTYYKETQVCKPHKRVCDVIIWTGGYRDSVLNQSPSCNLASGRQLAKKYRTSDMRWLTLQQNF